MRTFSAGPPATPSPRRLEKVGELLLPTVNATDTRRAALLSVKATREVAGGAVSAPARGVLASGPRRTATGSRVRILASRPHKSSRISIDQNLTLAVSERFE